MENRKNGKDIKIDLHQRLADPDKAKKSGAEKSSNYLSALDFFARGCSALERNKRDFLHADIHPSNRSKVNMGQKAPCVNLKIVERPAKGRDFEGNTRCYKANALVTQLAAVNFDFDFRFDLCRPAKEMRYGLFVQGNTKSRSEITKHGCQEIV
jgi:hypothetical protein